MNMKAYLHLGTVQHAVAEIRTKTEVMQYVWQSQVHCPEAYNENSGDHIECT
jgi:hypothetical protein